MSLIRSVSGLRGIIDYSLSDEVIKTYCHAFSSILGAGSIVIGRDGRPSGLIIEKLIIGILNNSGREVINLGIVPTPTIQLMVEKFSAAGGIAITASHNPGEWNGLKFMDKTGIFLDDTQNNKLWEIVDNFDKKFFQSDNKGNLICYNEAIHYHIKKILELPLFRDTQLLDKLSQRNIFAVVDAVNASGSVAISSLLAQLKCGIFPLYCDSSGVFPHTPEPLPQNLTALALSVKELNADIGIAVDPDADRLVLVDENGKHIGEEKTIVLAVWSLLRHFELFEKDYEKNIVVNLSTTRMVDDIASIFGAKVFRSPVGEINVVTKMKELNCLIGGEGSGGVILSSCHYGRDSLVGVALVLSLMADTGMKLSELSDKIPYYSMVKFKKNFTGDINDIIEKINVLYSTEKINTDDGIRVDLIDSWVQLRKSNTEPIIRIIAEARDSIKANYLADQFIDLL